MEVYAREIWRVDRSSSPKPIYLRGSKDSRRQAFRFNGRVPVTVQYEGRSLQFVTINYSEIGMLIKPVDLLPMGVLRPGSLLTGLIGSETEATPFRGVVLRVDDGARHAVKIIPET